jgi:DNA-binding LacI/PurR family transcriptional regulator
MTRNAGIKDVALRAQVSVGTVSNFLNGVPVSESKHSVRAAEVRVAYAHR